METTADPSRLDDRIARRLKALRVERGWSLDDLAKRSGVSRATLSRLEKADVSATAAALGKLCSAYGLTMSRLMLQVEGSAPARVAHAAQPVWEDPETGFQRRTVSPPTPAFAAEVVECTLPPGTHIAYDRAPHAGLEHHLVLLEGALTVRVNGTAHRLEVGDCLRYRLDGPSAFTAEKRQSPLPPHSPVTAHAMTVSITTLDDDGLLKRLDGFAELLHAAVLAGASINFILPFSRKESAAFWRDTVVPAVASGERVLFAALEGEALVGTVQLITAMPPNQPHRAEVTKLIVHPNARRRGIARSLMARLEEAALNRQRTLITLDTRTGDSAEPLYRSLGYTTAGTIPGFCRDTATDRLDATTIMYKAMPG
ncbi:MAG: GNAT family N-acetyltransferase [Pseudomonadota bacterium]